MTKKTSLQHQLEQYSLTVKGQTSSSRSAAEIAGYVAAAGAALAMASTADASIIYSGVQNIPVQINPNAVATGTYFLSNPSRVNIDIDGGGADISVGVSFAGYRTGLYGGGAFIAGLSTDTSLRRRAWLLQGANPRNGGANLPLSFTVGLGGNFEAPFAGIGLRFSLLILLSATSLSA